jgi:endogenous inhibitor of DNA gyrase (YacG/DUF329 family)
MAKETVIAGGDPLARESSLTKGRCPRCGKVITCAGKLRPKGHLRYRPFCSARCKLIDLGRWIDEEYHIASEKPLPDEKEPEKPG